MLKKFLAILSVPALIGSYFFVMQDSNESVQSPVSVPAQHGQQHPPLVESISSRSISVSSTTSDANHHKSGEESSSINNVANVPIDEIAMKKSENFSRYSQSLNEKGLLLQDDLLEKFQKEPVDSEWAPFYEEKIRHFFTQTKNLNYFVPDSVACKTTKCQIQLHVANDQEFNEAAQLFSSAFHANKVDIQPSEVVVVPDFSRKVLLFYISKNNDYSVYQ